jgi:hypothetical protein
VESRASGPGVHSCRITRVAGSEWGLSRVASVVLAAFVIWAFRGCGNARVSDDASPACTTRSSMPLDFASPATGTLSGPNLSADVCVGGTFAYLERTVYGRLIMIINSASEEDGVRFRLPTDALRADFATLLGVSTATPGTYSSANGDCGGIALCIYFPVPPSVDCGDSSVDCPPGCGLEGPVSDPLCMPINPETCYEANAASDCVGAATQQGSWTLKLVSVGPFVVTDGGTAGEGTFPVHGTFNAKMPSDADAGTGTATLDLTF